MLCNLMIASYIVYADVIREDGYNNYEGQFTVVHKGRMLRVLMYFNNVPLEACALDCVRHIRCRTFNYHPVKKACELTDEDFDKLDADKISLGWYNHGTPPKVNGGWSHWKDFTECTKTCGSGTLEQWRDCDSPKPEHGGADCKGRIRRTVTCNTHGCTVVNVASGKTAKQSSRYSPIYTPSKAVDGDPFTYACTRYETNQWWEVDLGNVKVIKYIRLNAFVGIDYNKGLMVETWRNMEESWMLCKDLGKMRRKITKFTCEKPLTNAQLLRIRSTKKCYLCIVEVEIFVYKNN